MQTSLARLCWRPALVYKVLLRSSLDGHSSSLVCWVRELMSSAPTYSAVSREQLFILPSKREVMKPGESRMTDAQPIDNTISETAPSDEV